MKYYKIVAWEGHTDQRCQTGEYVKNPGRQMIKRLKAIVLTLDPSYEAQNMPFYTFDLPALPTIVVLSLSQLNHAYNWIYHKYTQ